MAAFFLYIDGCTKEDYQFLKCLVYLHICNANNGRVVDLNMYVKIKVASLRGIHRKII